MNNSVIKFELFQGLVINNTVRIVHGIIFPVGLIISTIFYWGTIYYERYGGDPMKRTIQNKLISAIALSIVMRCYTTNIVIAWRLQIGPLNDSVAMVAVFIDALFETFMMVNLSEITIYKVRIFPNSYSVVTLNNWRSQYLYVDSF